MGLWRGEGDRREGRPSVGDVESLVPINAEFRSAPQTNLEAIQKYCLNFKILVLKGTKLYYLGVKNQQENPTTCRYF